ncbi:MAG: proline dehydrogenase [Acidobacteria bacterium]|nr:proline dehydrogenase [Acidobacteriota bacterium]
MTRALRRLMWAAWEPAARRAARAYVAGPELHDALRVCDELAGKGFRTAICPWHSEQTSRTVADSYLRALRALDGAGRDCYLSIKAPDLEYSSALMDEILEAARSSSTTIHFDALGPEAADRTWQLIEASAGRGVTIGCTLPARWRRSVSDVDRVLALDLRVRIVKGQWEDPEGAVRDVEAAYLSLIDRLAGRGRQVAVATHVPRLARRAVDSLHRAGSTCELELLFGLPTRGTVDVARRGGVPIRFYVPYGHAWLPYSLSQLRRHPGILYWTFRDWLKGSRRTLRSHAMVIDR